MAKNYDIFISYRRFDDNGNISGRDQARLIAKQLELKKYHSFFDYSEITDNEFDKIILPAVRGCKVFILVLTKDSLCRCANEDDWVRCEIETAIESGCKIILVSPDNSFNGWPQSLPNSLAKIKTIHISDIHMGSFFEMSIEKLIKERISKVFATKAELTPNESYEYLDNSQVTLVEPWQENVCFSNTNVPIAIMYGPACAGKTMTIARLARYLKEQGYSMRPNRLFRQVNEKTYQSVCDNFQNMVNNSFAASGTSCMDTILLDINSPSGELILQILDAAGEYYFNENKSQSRSIVPPIFLNSFINSPNPKIWIFFVTPFWGNHTLRMDYVSQIRKLHAYFRKSDNFILLLNQIDRLELHESRIKNEHLLGIINEEYPGLMYCFKNNNFFTKIFHKFSCSVLPFQTGVFSSSVHGSVTYSPGPVSYVEKFWKLLKQKTR